MFQAMKLTKRVSSKHSAFFLISIFVLALISIILLHYILNIQYQKPNRPFLGGPVTSPPKSLRIDLEQPDDNLLVYQPSIIISGKTTPNSEVLIYQDSKDFIIKSTSSGTFSTILNLDEGENRIRVVVFDTNGDTRETERTVYYSKEKL